VVSPQTNITGTDHAQVVSGLTYKRCRTKPPKPREFGFKDAHLTGSGADAGVDVLSRRAVARVKWKLSGAIGRPDVQRLLGVAQAAKSKPVFFSGSGYTAEARSWAEMHGIAAFNLTDQGEVVPITTAARKMARV
jgi:hypothetical protein